MFWGLCGFGHRRWCTSVEDARGQGLGMVLIFTGAYSLPYVDIGIMEKKMETTF